MPPEDLPGFLPKTGNYRGLLSCRKVEIIYDFTFRFCEKFLKRGDRTDQMVQAARSGKQNIAEGAKASKTSTETELKLTNVARASLEELLVDYEDFLRARDLPLWSKDGKEALFIRKLGKQPDDSFETYRPFFADRPAEVLCQHRPLPHPPSQLPPRSTHPPPRKRLRRKRRPPRTHDPRPPRLPRPPAREIDPTSLHLSAKDPSSMKKRPPPSKPALGPKPGRPYHPPHRSPPAHPVPKIAQTASGKLLPAQFARHCLANRPSPSVGLTNKSSSPSKTRTNVSPSATASGGSGADRRLFRDEATSQIHPATTTPSPDATAWAAGPGAIRF